MYRNTDVVANMHEKRKAPAPQHSDRQPKKPCQQRNSAVLDPVNIDQEWGQALIQTVKGSSIHYWIQNNQWPKKHFNSVLGKLGAYRRRRMEKKMKRAIGIVLKPISETNFVFYLKCKGSYLNDNRNGNTKDDMKMCQVLSRT
ncbi:uncharacterized protein BO88DRAFT_480987 [Aspergillus vadensis CBS 113365]|uniref:Uncharacterized protein n=1 Tax=Aspergillus vadensis (strain CBS 113365 / IMI 142717 / IBT 24658) TaxID=1448311 RepID=A0A319BVA8_ASPVC|nr:hypothetical protein BO88DRAFT_480987 [Aspergillus vadensis CBS 113365]PYH69773.1 hypothetical protein BO88DRAFT_480987 [Aspergillus vadensis CBS 113365]